ncbi:hypothetical protein Q31b_11060 [Novipirellula aureliae]|uniref:Cell division protein FtsQ n=1 Tax=Novipirellula aureliae TaxID=2527966 RepID=A0A5C6EB03_9BACT|nr:hypothetical protein [Novipirellula aureliae]TWU45930.1 hypothetical protein Q31b_11060 [Novipirellula aureliae]
MVSDRDRPRPIRDLLKRLITAPASLSFIWPVLLIIGGYAAWDRWGAEHVGKKYYGVELEQIRISPPPEHVRTDIAATVFRDFALDQLSLLDSQASAKIASAFATHPWISRVISVRKLPGGAIDVHLEYRRPVAMVPVIKPDQEVGFFPIDGAGILLPTTTDFAEAETLDYIHIEVPGVYPTGVLGSPFGDYRVEAAAKLADLLATHREQLQIRSIGVRGDSRTDEVPQLELTMTSNRCFTWGSPPGMERLEEQPAEMKLQALLQGDEIRNSDLRIARKPSGGP